MNDHAQAESDGHGSAWCPCTCHAANNDDTERRVIPDGPPLVYGRDWHMLDTGSRTETDDVVDPTVQDVHRDNTHDPDLWDDDTRHGDDGGER